MLRIDFSKEAEFDLEEIVDFIALDSRDRALVYLEKNRRQYIIASR